MCALPVRHLVYNSKEGRGGSGGGRGVGPKVWRGERGEVTAEGIAGSVGAAAGSWRGGWGAGGGAGDPTCGGGGWWHGVWWVQGATWLEPREGGAPAGALSSACISIGLAYGFNVWAGPERHAYDSVRKPSGGVLVAVRAGFWVKGRR